MQYKTWDEFWAKFLQITFHLNTPDRWSRREQRALWCQTHLGIQPGATMLNVGCGDGVLDICLSRLGMQVTAVDRNASVLNHAKSEDDTGRVKFVTSDLRRLELPDSSFEAALFLECSGLVTQDEDLKLFKNIYRWLRPGGKFLMDCPVSAELSGSWSKTFPEGELIFHHSFDPSTRIFRIVPTFKEPSGKVFGLMDPLRDHQPGLSRYYYPKEEITSMLNAAGFTVRDAEPHYYGDQWFALVATR